MEAPIKSFIKVNCFSLKKYKNITKKKKVLFQSEIFKEINELTRSKKLGKIAAELLGIDSVRYYQDGVFVKVNN